MRFVCRNNLTEAEEDEVLDGLVENTPTGGNNVPEIENADAPIDLNAAVVLPVVELNLPPPPPPPPPEADVDPLLLPNGVLWEEIEGVNIEKHPHKFGRKSTIHMPRTRVDRVEKVEDYSTLCFHCKKSIKLLPAPTWHLQLRIRI